MLNFKIGVPIPTVLFHQIGDAFFCFVHQGKGIRAANYALSTRGNSSNRTHHEEVQSATQFHIGKLFSQSMSDCVCVWILLAGRVSILESWYEVHVTAVSVVWIVQLCIHWPLKLIKDLLAKTLVKKPWNLRNRPFWRWRALQRSSLRCPNCHGAVAKSPVHHHCCGHHKKILGDAQRQWCRPRF